MGDRLSENLIQHPRCPYCHDDVRPEAVGQDEVQGCPACLGWSHAACWKEHGGCAACGQEVVRPLGSTAGPAPPLRGRGYLGVAYVDVEQGVHLYRIENGSAAHMAGLAVDDVILTVNGWPAKTATLRPALRSSRAGERWELTILRSGHPSKVEVELGEHTQTGWLGVAHAQSARGAIVTFVDPSSPAYDAGLGAGDVIVEIDGQRASSPRLSSALRGSRPGQVLELLVERDGQRRRVQPVLEARSERGPADRQVGPVGWVVLACVGLPFGIYMLLLLLNA